ncbi:MAG: succinate dehydrogenase cytochrome b subunit [Actinomycetota bacterium]|nr:succinate dehydrogenase cytochrome b subunit [Actinomycetota bacterium]
MAQATGPRPHRQHPIQQQTLIKGSRAARNTIALKMLMAVSGIAFIGFVLGHMYGNLKAFAGHDAFNDYAHHLRVLGEPLLPHQGFLWILRVGLIVALVVHVACAYALWRRARRARTVKYVVKKNNSSTFSSHWMRWGGVAILVFVVWHLLNFTIGKVNPQGGETDDPYNLLVDTFDLWWMTLIYLAAMVALALHLRHGVWSAAQTLGLTNNERARRNANLIGYGLAVLVAGGFSLVPIFVLAGVIEK